VREEQLKDIRPFKPDQFVQATPLWSGPDLLAFQAREAADFDWVERMILTHGYYEHAGVWDLALSNDKQAMAEIMAMFRPERALEIGCSTGAVLHYLRKLGVPGEGVEISQMAIQRAFPDVRDHIHEGDLLDLSLTARFDLVYGLDIFEHLNPNRLGDYLARVAALLADGGYLYAALPAFGDDPVFGLIFPMYLRDWYGDVAKEQPFHLLHVDGKGYPLNGHLVWADSRWWVTQFERHGLRRDEAIERAVHQRYDRFFDSYAPARKAFYVFSKNGRPETSEAIAYRLLSEASPALGEVVGMLPPSAHVLANDHVFYAGWHRLEGGAHGPFRWSERRAEIRLTAPDRGWLRLRVFTHSPQVGRRRPVTARFVDRASGQEVARVTLTSRKPVAVSLPLSVGETVVELFVDVAWVPKLMLAGSEDGRELGIGVQDVEITREPGGAPAPRARPARVSVLDRLRARGRSFRAR
jgi:SAM-dependent methyltransferase